MTFSNDLSLRLTGDKWSGKLLLSPKRDVHEAYDAS